MKKPVSTTITRLIRRVHRQYEAGLITRDQLNKVLKPLKRKDIML